VWRSGEGRGPFIGREGNGRGSRRWFWPTGRRGLASSRWGRGDVRRVASARRETEGMRAFTRRGRESRRRPPVWRLRACARRGPGRARPG
jgi:hypothetical protein